MNRLKLYLTLCAVYLMLPSCSIDDDPNYVACTDVLIVHTVTILQPNGDPADSVQITVRNKESGQPYDLCQDIYCEETVQTGEFVIMHDGFVGEISKEEEEMIVEGEKDSLGFSEEFSFYDDECHIRKIAGPDTVYLRSN